MKASFYRISAIDIHHCAIEPSFLNYYLKFLNMFVLYLVIEIKENCN